MRNPFSVTKAESFNHAYDELAVLMQFRSGVAGVLLSNSHVFIEGSRGSGKSMYLRMLSRRVKSEYQRLAEQGDVDRLPSHSEFFGVYAKLTPTIFSPHENENHKEFRPYFQALFNVYIAEAAITSLIEASELNPTDTRSTLNEFHSLFLNDEPIPNTLDELGRILRQKRKFLRRQLDKLSYTDLGEVSNPETLWEMGQLISDTQSYRKQRIFILLDEFDSLSTLEQSIINSYLRNRDFPITFKIGCKKHRLSTQDYEGRPLNPSGDFDRIELDDDDFGLTSTFSEYLQQIANRRLKRVGITADIREILGTQSPEKRPNVERKYAGFEQVSMLSSGIVRPFLELCRDIFDEAQQTVELGKVPVVIDLQDRVIKRHASTKWNQLSRDQSARIELQRLIAQVAELFARKSTKSEKQIIRLEIIDFDRSSKFLRSLLTDALEYEALLQPNRERLQKNKKTTSRGYLLHRLFCVHFRLDIRSRWDAEISSDQLQALVVGDSSAIDDVVEKPTSRKKQTQPPANQPSLFIPRLCPILDRHCPEELRTQGQGFLSCRLPKHGKIRDAIKLLKEAFEEVTLQHSANSYSIKTAEDFAPTGDIACKVCHAFAVCEFVLCEMSGLSPSVSMELGLAIARRMPTFVLFDHEEQREVPEPFSSIEYYSYSISPQSVDKLVHEKILPFLQGGDSDKCVISIGPEPNALEPEGEGVFVALPADDFHQETVLPAMKTWIEESGFGPVKTETEGQSLSELDRAAKGIAKSRYCLIDTTHGAATRALYLGMAQGYHKRFANLVDAQSDENCNVFTNARSKSEIIYRDTEELLRELEKFFANVDHAA